MSEAKKIATRDSYGNALVELGRTVDNIVVLDADLAAATKTGVFKKVFPERHIDCGIAEGNMINVAAGISTMGLISFASSFVNVKICATHGGISVGADGASHQCCEDFALMRSIPGMVVLSPSDDVEARQMIRAAYDFDGPIYIRFGRMATPVFHDENYKFVIGRGELLRAGPDAAIVATGILVTEAIRAAEILSEKNISVRVINMPTIKPLDEKIILEAARDCKKIITVEEHNVIGGLGEAVCSLLAEKYPVPVKKIGVNDEFGHSGAAGDLLKQFGLCADNIVKQTESMVRDNVV